MVNAPNLFARLTNILAARGKTADFLSDVIVQDNSDGNGPFLASWDEAKLGPTPTQAEVDAASDQPNPKTAILTQLAAIDAQGGMNRGVRESILALGALTKMLNSAGVKDAAGNLVPDTTTNIGMVNVQKLEDQAHALRAQLAALP